MLKLYSYIGSPDLLSLSELPQRQLVRCKQDVLNWISNTQQVLDDEKSSVATFIIDADKQLWIADRHSEHVQCARGQPVLSAGEITFTLTRSNLVVSAITNQSTGYCPESESWEVVASALESANLIYPSDFTSKFVFRRCGICGTINIVKYDWFYCGVCNSNLPKEWNFDL
ncbi:hypothetical protein NIES4071_35370 [Calothrix sp. NIES-4071]|nr:hypothetical protein NIES4071_35370 [Calothrix sp. NIES-4071]BAZ57856.1 hypothetical protein NIES4105_35300 [Calothrix sp. NIES-4105]